MTSIVFLNVSKYKWFFVRYKYIIFRKAFQRQAKMPGVTYMSNLQMPKCSKTLLSLGRIVLKQGFPWDGTYVPLC